MAKADKKKKLQAPSVKNKAGEKVPAKQELNRKMTINVEDLRKRKLMIGTPMYGGQCTGPFAFSVLGYSKVCQQHGLEVEHVFHYNESLIQRARNYVVDAFLRSDCTHLMFIDSDIAFNPMDLLALLALSEPGGDRQLICGIYPKKQVYWDRVKMAVEKGVNIKNADELAAFSGGFAVNFLPGVQEFSLLEPVEIMEAATGFLMIQREVFEKWDEAYPETAYFPDHKGSNHFDGSRKIHAYFDCEIHRDYDIGDVKKLASIEDPVELQAAFKALLAKEDTATLRYLSEDYWFSHKARALGYKIWMCPWINLVHVGTYAFQGNLGALSAIGASPN